MIFNCTENFIYNTIISHHLSDQSQKHFWNQKEIIKITGARNSDNLHLHFAKKTISIMQSYWMLWMIEGNSDE